MKNKQNFIKTLITSACLIGAGEASAAAFQLAEISTAGLGRAYAGDAVVAENASIVATNPAAMTLFTKPEISVGAIYIDPTINIKGKIQSSGYDTSHSNIAPNAISPHLYGILPINNKFALGSSINVNYGLATEFNKNYSAGFFGGNTDLKTINFNVSGAYRLFDNFSIGMGINAVYADAKIERYAGKLSVPLRAQLKAQLSANGIPQGQAEAISNAKIQPSTIIKRLEGKKWGLGWNVGLMYEFNPNNRLGLAYHSKVDINFDGRFTGFYTPDNSSPSQLVTDKNGKLTLVLPAYLEFSGYHKMTDKFAVNYSIKHTFWSKFKELKAVGPEGQEWFQKTEKFKDTTRIALGASYDINDSLTLRTGIAYDESAANDHKTISIPDTDRTWYSIGATYRFTPNLSVDVAYAHVHGKKISFTEKDSDTLPAIKVSSKAKVNIYGLNLNYRF